MNSRTLCESHRRRQIKSLIVVSTTNIVNAATRKLPFLFVNKKMFPKSSIAPKMRKMCNVGVCDR